MLAAELFAASGVLLNSLAIVRTDALANVALLGALFLLTDASRSTNARAFIAGVAAGIAIGMRLAVAPTALVFAVLALRRGPMRLALFTAGGLLASLPWLIVALRAPEQFWFCNVTFHSLRREMIGVGPMVARKWA